MLEGKFKDIEYIRNLKENQYFDKKSARIKPQDILKHIVAFSNADGGKLVIGIEDDGRVTGFEKVGHSVDDFKNIALIKLTFTPVIANCYELNVINNFGRQDVVLIIDVKPSYNRVITSYDGHVYLRFNDSSQCLNHEQVLQLKYDRGESSYETELCADLSLDDLDQDLIQEYLIKIESKISAVELLEARGLVKNNKITNAGVLLFSKEPTKFLPHARLRFIRYDGLSAEVGTSINIIKEKTFDSSIPKIIRESVEFIRTQFREFQYLSEDGIFSKMPEYPEFAWVEGIVNALTHRNYSISGEHIKVIMYDDRLEIHSPGVLPNIVTLKNIKNQRYSRNPIIARILSEFGWVKELNEGVKRIYKEMESYFLNEPIYSEPNNNSVLLLLENNVLNRRLRNLDSIERIKGSIKELTGQQKTILRYAYNKGKITTTQAAKLIKRSSKTAKNELTYLVDNNFLDWIGMSKTDPKQYYIFNKNKR